MADLTLPVSLVIEVDEDWRDGDNMDNISLVAFIGTEKETLATIRMSGYDAKQRPGEATRRLLRELLK